MMISLVVPITHAAGPLWPTVCTPGDISANHTFCDQSKDFHARAKDLVSKLTLVEKQSLLDNGAAGVPRLGIPPYQWWSEGLHGPLEPCVKDGGVTKCPTSFPAGSAMASAFNDTLYLAVGSAVGIEGRAISNLRKHDSHIGDGLTYWAPNANMERDPRWGRNQEAPGEDPHLTGQYIAHYVRGLQEGADSEHVQMVATCKHFIANSLEHSTINGTVVTRHNFDAEIPLPELVDYYMPGFKACVQEGRALGIMCSYNAVNGVPMCANERLLGDVLRGEWGFDGYVTSDCGAISDIYKNHNWPPNPIDKPNPVVAAAAGLRAGCDTDCGGVYGGNVVKAVDAHVLSEATVDASIMRLVKIQMRLGLFAPKTGQPYFDKTKYGIEQVDSPAHQQLALEAALQSTVLLKNDKGTLPLKPGGKLALIGPHVYGRDVFLSNYHGDRCPDRKFECIPSPNATLTAANVGGVTTSVQGVDVASTKVSNISAAVAAAVAADTIVLLVGIDGRQEGEEHDRSNCTLPGLQEQLVTAVAALGKPTVLVLINGGAMCLGQIKDKVPAVVEAFYGGEQGASAIADVIFGKYNPTGKLPVTMYPPEYMEQIPLTQMSVSAPPGRTHLYYTGTPDFAFGSGLSYSNVSCALRTDGGTQTYRLALTNRGPMAGGQRILAYARPVNGPRSLPRQRLWGYQAVGALGVGETSKIVFTLAAADLAVADASGHRVLTPGQEYEIAFSDGGHNELRARVRLTGPARVVERSALAP